MAASPTRPLPQGVTPSAKAGIKRESPQQGGSIIGPEAVTLVCTATAHHTRTTGQEPRRAGAGAPTREPEHRREGRDRWPKNPAARRQRGGRLAGAHPWTRRTPP